MRRLLIFALSSSIALAQSAGVGRAGSSNSIPALQITTTSPLPTGTINVAYTPFQMQATGGVPPYTPWTCPATCNFPSTMVVSSGGNITGTPASSGSFTVGIKVCDSGTPQNCTATTNFSLTINAASTGCASYASNRTVSASDTSQVPPSGSKLNVAGAAYCLNADITNTDSAIAWQADNMTLNLTSHTVTYATTDAAAQPRFAIVGLGCTEADASGNPCGGSWKNPLIYGDTCPVNGTGQPTSCTAQLIQGAGAVGINDAVRFGGNSGGGAGSGGTLHDFATVVSHPTTSQPGKKASASVHFRYGNGPIHAYNLFTNNSEGWVVNRTNLEGPDFRLENWSGSSGDQCEVDHNNFSGAGQGGILTYEQHDCLIHHNLVGTNGHAIQDFAIFVYGTNDQVYNNTIDCTSCRGIFMSGHNFHPPNGANYDVHDNTLTIRMLPQYCNDGACADSSAFACETHGSYAAQFDDQVQGSSFHNNAVTGIVQNGTDGGGNPSSCNIAALRVTALGDDNNTSHDNTFNIKRADSSVTGKAIGFYTESSPSHPFASTDDTFNTDSFNIFIDWQGALGNQTFLRPIFGQPAGGSPDSGYKTYHWFNGFGGNCGSPSTCPSHLFIIDPTYNNGAGRDSQDMTTYGGNHGPAELFHQYTYKPLVQCAPASTNCTPGNAVSGVLAVINDVTPTQVFSNTTDAGGHLNAGAGVVLTEFRRANCATENFGNTCSTGGAAVKTMKTPHSVTFSKALCTTISNHAVDLTNVTLASAILTETVLISCP